MCSRGSRFDARLPVEARGGDYVVLSKQLHDVHERNYKSQDLRRIGYHPNIINGLIQIPEFVDRLTSLVAQALQNRRVVLVFECAKGRHRSVAATFLACLLFEHFIGHGAVQIEPVASRNWGGTCRGNCAECSGQPTPKPDKSSRDSQMRCLPSCRLPILTECRGPLGTNTLLRLQITPFWPTTLHLTVCPISPKKLASARLGLP